MDKIKIGNRTFFLGMITAKTLKMLEKQIKGLTIPDPDKEGKANVGDALLFVLTAIYDGDEEKAFEIGQELAQAEIENVRIEQLIEAIKMIRNRIEKG
nr:MAG TPA: hypothetical protein [Caudoviricetes sp.]